MPGPYGGLGLARQVVLGAASMINATALLAGDYLLTVESGAIYILRGSTNLVAATALNGAPVAAPNVYQFTVEDLFSDADRRGWLAILRSGAAATVSISRQDEPGLTVQPPVWA